MFIMEETQNKPKADIRIIGVGGGGSNALEIMIKEGIQGVQFIALNTDDQALEASSAQTKIQLGSKLTKGLGAGANPEIGRRAAIESHEEIVKALEGADMVFVTAGMGGGTGTGGAPLVAQAASELGILTVGIVTNPFLFEGQKRMKQAEQGINELGKYIDTLIVIPNEKLLQFSKKDIPLFETFKITDNILLQAVKGIAELVSVPGLINLDFADIKTVMVNKGMALMGRGLSKGPDRAKKAVLQAISSPLLDSISIEGATGMIVNITAGPSLSLIEVQEASSALTQAADDSADIILGTVIDKNMRDQLSVTVIATGFPGKKINKPSLYIKKDLIETSPAREKDPEKQIIFTSESKRDNPENKPISIISNQNENLSSYSEEKEQAPQKEWKASQDLESNSEREDFLHAENDNITESETIKSPPTPNKAEKFQTKQKDAYHISNPEKRGTVAKNKDHSPYDQNEYFNLKVTNKKNNPYHAGEKQPKTNKQLSPKEKLLLKVREYAQNQRRNKKTTEENQMSMNWEKTSLEENLSSPYESSIDFSEEDMI